jgi:hypothetical protein
MAPIAVKALKLMSRLAPGGVTGEVRAAPALRRATCSLLVVIAACTSAPPGTRWILPDGFRGCVEVTYGVAGAKPLVIEDGFQVIAVPATEVEANAVAWSPSGRPILWQHRTSSAPRLGERQRTEVYYESAPGRRLVRPETGGHMRTPVSESASAQLEGAGTAAELACFGAER